MILLNSEKQCIYMHKGRRAAVAAAAYIPLSTAAAAAAAEDAGFPKVIGCILFNMGAKLPYPEDH
jgi:hypothetical protein